MIMILMLVIFGINRLSERTEDYSQEQMMQDLTAGNITQVVITPNSETPTGVVQVVLKNGAVRKLYVTNVEDAEDLIRSYNIAPVIQDVKRESWLMTNLLPMLIVLVVGIFLLMVFFGPNDQAAGNNRMMNFGRSRAKMSKDDNKVNFDSVAGLKEEKEELGRSWIS